jgi:homoserine O-acetyltransferase
MSEVVTDRRSVLKTCPAENRVRRGSIRIPFALSSGPLVRDVTLAYRLEGPGRGPLVVILGGISADRNPMGHEGRAGWWECLVGPGKPVDSHRYQVLSMDYLGGAHGSTQACELEAQILSNGGQSFGTDSGWFLTSEDQATALVKVMDALGLKEVDHFIGASFGGMVGLTFCQRYPARVRSLLCISAAHESVPQAIALRHVQRTIVTISQRHGAAASGLSLARQLAMLTYRTPEELNQRFKAGERSATHPDGILSYLEHCGDRFALQWHPLSFLALSDAIDRHRVLPEALETPLHLIGVDSDQLVPFTQLEELARRVRGPVSLSRLSSPFGHDAFLKEYPVFSTLLNGFLGAAA